MTFIELKNEVAALGFENRIYDTARLLSFARRAQKTIFSDRAVTKTIKIYVPGIKTMYRLENFEHRCGERELLNISGKAYCIEAFGTGKITITDGALLRTESFENANVKFKGFIESGNITVLLEGERSFRILRLAAFASVYVKDPDMIPDADGRIVNRDAVMQGDFLCFTGMPADKHGNICDCICMEDGAVTFTEGTEGEFYLTYRRAPMPINSDIPAEAIDIPMQCEHLLTLLCASYICLDYDEELSELYRNVYEAQMKELNKSTPTRISTGYRDVTGWA